MKKILIIEDERQIADSIKFNLEKEGFAVKVAENGNDGLGLIDSEYFDLIVLDLMLPGLEGLEHLGC